ncbi:TonB-dependent receptor [Bradyrhizobium jicamae]|uniref:TonB-dependent receptor n=1 Tax=Bradyrhizobium jicamae TaxID=280332 RepID=A0ABS5FHS4_9BRAD|nr:TonB-dependent receptor [Bradyrhizobium jicamae]MBR0796338.1 TonB-dependent receptor [Bradyrhizobium jicamae]
MLAVVETSDPAWAQSAQPLGPVVVSPPTQRGNTAQRNAETRGPAKRARRAARRSTPKPVPTPAPAPVTASTPLNSGVVAASATLLGLTVHETPASVEVVSQQRMQEQGYRTTTEAAQGAVGVLSGDAGGAFGSFSMRGFTGSEVTVLYNGIWIGPQDITSRVMDSSSLQQIEFLKGPSSIMSGLGAIGGSVNYVSNQPTTGPIRNQLDTSIDSLGTYRTHFGSGGSTTLPGLDYRFDIGTSKVNSFIDGDYQQLSNVSGQLNYRVNESFKVFGAIEYRQDDGHAYWGTPLTTTTFSGPFSTHGVVAGSAINTFDGVTVIAPVTIDSRTVDTNYNVADNSVGAKELWLRGGFEWNVSDSVTIKNQAYAYGARRHWYDSETYAFDTATSMIDRDRFFVTHKQQVIGDNTDVIWNTSFFGMENRLATQFSVSRNDITFTQEGGNTYPDDSVDVLNPVPGVYGVQSPDVRNSHLTDAAISVEDRLKLTPMLSLIGGIRVEDLTLSRDGVNFDGSIPAGQPFSTTWNPVSYRGAITFEPIKGLMLYGMYATAYDPAAAGIFSVTPGTSLELTSARIYEAGLKMISDDKRAEATFAAYDIVRNNVYVALTNAVSTLAGEVHTKGIELSAAVRPIDNVKIWGNVALTQSRYGDFDVWTGNTPSNVAPIVINAGASYRFNDWRWPVEIGGSVRHVGQRYLFEDDLTAMLPYTTADLYAFVDIPGRDLRWQGLETMRVTFRVRNITNALYAQWSDPGYPDQVYLGAPRTFELSASAKW